MITVDSGGVEFIGKALDAWACERQVTLLFNRQSRQVDNAIFESMNGRLRDECLSRQWFIRLNHARQVIGQWREEYQTVRPNSGLGVLTPEEFLIREAEIFQEQVILYAGQVN